MIPGERKSGEVDAETSGRSFAIGREDVALLRSIAERLRHGDAADLRDATVLDEVLDGVVHGTST